MWDCQKDGKGKRWFLSRVIWGNKEDLDLGLNFQWMMVGFYELGLVVLVRGLCQFQEKDQRKELENVKVKDFVVFDLVQGGKWGVGWNWLGVLDRVWVLFSLFVWMWWYSLVQELDLWVCWLVKLEEWLKVVVVSLMGDVLVELVCDESSRWNETWQGGDILNIGCHGSTGTCGWDFGGKGWKRL